MKQFVIFERGWLMNYYRQLVENRKMLSDARLVQERTHNTSKGFILLPNASRCGNISIETFIEKYL